jgi:hypothetical protein
MSQVTAAIVVVVLIFFGLGFLVLTLVALLGERLLKIPHIRVSSIYELILISFLVSLACLFAWVVITRNFSISWKLDQPLLLVAIVGLGIYLATFRHLGTLLPFKSITTQQLIVILSSAALIIVMMVGFYDYLSFNQFSDDEQEAVQFALSLRTHAFPYWDLENGYWGFYHSFMLFAYPMYILTAFLGETEFVFRLLYFLALYISLIASVSLFELLSGRAIQLYELATLLLGAILLTVLAGFFSSWDPYIAGIGEPSAVEFLGFSLFLCAVFFLFVERHILFLGFSIAHFAALPNGFPYTMVLLGLTFLLESKKRLQVTNLAVMYTIIVASYYFLYSAFYPDGNKWTIEEFGDRYFTRFSDLWSAGQFMLVICLISGGTIISTYLILTRSKNIQARILAIFSLLHVLPGLIFYNLQHIHYYLPFFLLLYVLGIFGVGLLYPKVRLAAIAFVQTVLCFALIYVFPSHIFLLENAKALGRLTRVQCHDISLSTLYSDVKDFSKLISWGNHGITLHNWIYYSRRPDKASQADLLIIDIGQKIPDGYYDLGSGSNCRLVVRRDFVPNHYLPHWSYRLERAWNLLGVPRWRNHFEPDS